MSKKQPLYAQGTGARWSSWFERAANPGSWLASSSAPRRRSATGCVKRIATRNVVRTGCRVRSSRSSAGFVASFAGFAKNETSWQKLRPGSLGRPARYRGGLRAREREPGPSWGSHDVPGAGRLPQRVLRVARSWTVVSGPSRRGVARDDSPHPPRFAWHVRDAAGARAAARGRMAKRTRARARGRT